MGRKGNLGVLVIGTLIRSDRRVVELLLNPAPKSFKCVSDNLSVNIPPVNPAVWQSEAEHFLGIFKKVLYFAIFAHSPPAPGQANTKYAAWARVKEYAEKFLSASADAKFDRRVVIGAMANVFDRSLIALGRIKYAVHWCPKLRREYMDLWQTLTDRRMMV